MLMIKQSLIDYAEVFSSIVKLKTDMYIHFDSVSLICAKSQLEEVATIIWGDKRE